MCSSDLEDYFGRTAMVGRHGEGHLEIGCIALDEGIARVLRPRPTFLARGRHGEREILRSVPDRDEAGEGMPPLGPRRERIHRLLPGLWSPDPRARPPAGHEGGPRHAHIRGHDDFRHPARARGDLRRTPPADLPAGWKAPLHRVGHRGHDPRGPHRAGVSTTTDDREVRGTLPRWSRRVPRLPFALARPDEE